MLEPFPVVQLREVVLDLVENEDLEVELSHCILIELLLFLALDILASENVQVLFIRILQTPVVGFQSQVGLHYLLKVCLQDFLLLLDRPWRSGECLFLFR